MLDQLILASLITNTAVSGFKPALAESNNVNLYSRQQVYQLAQQKSVQEGLDKIFAEMVRRYGQGVSVGKSSTRTNCPGDQYEYTVARPGSVFNAQPKRTYACFHFITGAIYINTQALN